MPIRISKGDRVGVMLGGDEKRIRFLGYGYYDGDEVPPPEAGGFNVGIPVPKLVLDNGKIVYGCESWWGSEEAMKRRCYAWENSGLVIETVDIDEARAAGAERQESET